jgi:hypothetical protein
MCSHIRSKTDETEYKDTHSERPSNEIQTTINLLFKEKEEGLYTQDFASISLLQLPIHARHKLLLCVLMFHLNLVN